MPTPKKSLSNGIKRMQEEKMPKEKNTAKYRNPDISKYGIGQLREIGISVPSKAPKTKVSTVKQVSTKGISMPTRSTSTKVTKKSGKLKNKSL